MGRFLGIQLAVEVRCSRSMAVGIVSRRLCIDSWSINKYALRWIAQRGGFPKRPPGEQVITKVVKQFCGWLRAHSVNKGDLQT